MRNRFFMVVRVGIATSVLSGCGDVSNTTVYGDTSFSEGSKAEIGSGVIDTRVKDVNAFNKIVSYVGDISVSSCAPSVEVQFDDNLIDKIITTVENNTLTLDYKGSYSSTLPLLINVCSNRISEVSSYNSSDLHLDLMIEELSAYAADSSSIVFAHLNTFEAKFHIENSALITAIGYAESYDLTLSDSGEYRAVDLLAENITLAMTDSSAAYINSQHALGDISGSSILYANNHAELNVKTMQSAQIILLNN